MAKNVTKADWLAAASAFSAVASVTLLGAGVLVASTGRLWSSVVLMGTSWLLLFWSSHLEARRLLEWLMTERDQADDRNLPEVRYPKLDAEERRRLLGGNWKDDSPVVQPGQDVVGRFTYDPASGTYSEQDRGNP